VRCPCSLSILTLRNHNQLVDDNDDDDDDDDDEDDEVGTDR